ncbi:Ion channel [Ostertagia ostertagi]
MGAMLVVRVLRVLKMARVSQVRYRDYKQCSLHDIWANAQIVDYRVEHVEYVSTHGYCILLHYYVLFGKGRTSLRLLFNTSCLLVVCTFGQTLKSSITELSMLSMFLLTGIVFFSTIMYYLEKDEPHSDFYSIPAACWWCVVTMATVGYGDAKPVTVFGKLVATATSICGIIVLAFPISMIVEKFATAQQRAIEDEQLNQAQVTAAANNYLLRRFPTRRKVRRERVNGTVAASPLISTVA